MALMKWLKMTCQDTSPLISESLDHGLSVTQRLRLTLHLRLCQACRCYLDQLRIIRHLARKLGEMDGTMGRLTKLRPEFKQKLKESIKST